MKSSAYPTKAAIKRIIEAARACGLDVCGFEATPDGTLRVLETRGSSAPLTDFDRWQDRL